MKVIIELDGKKYELRKSYKGKKGLCDSCALVDVCQKTGKRSNKARRISAICSATISGFREVKEGNKIKTLADADKRRNQIAHDFDVLYNDMKNAGFIGVFMEDIDGLISGFGYASLALSQAMHPVDRSDDDVF